MKHIFALCLAIHVCALSASAAPILSVPLPGGFFDNQYTTGSGSNTAYFVIDFGGTPGNPGNTYGFEYHWDGSQTADNALIAIAANGALDVTTSNFGSTSEPNLSIDTLTYLSETDTPDFFEDGRFWGYFLGSYSSANVTWTASDFGISGREFGDSGNNNGTPNEVLQFLADGGFYGFYASAELTAPRLPVAVPEPAAWMLAAIGGLLLIRGRIRNRRLLLRDAVEGAQAPR